MLKRAKKSAKGKSTTHTVDPSKFNRLNMNKALIEISGTLVLFKGNRYNSEDENLQNVKGVFVSDGNETDLGIIDGQRLAGFIPIRKNRHFVTQGKKIDNDKNVVTIRDLLDGIDEEEDDEPTVKKGGKSTLPKGLSKADAEAWRQYQEFQAFKKFQSRNR